MACYILNGRTNCLGIAVTVQGNTNGSHPVLSAPRGEQLDLLDALARPFRLLVGAAPCAVDLREVVAVVTEHGPKEAFRLICITLEREYPGWHANEALQELARPLAVRRRSRK